jgi:hypothetical protein
MQSGSNAIPEPTQEADFLDISLIEARAFALHDDRPRPLPVAVDHLLPRESDCPSLRRVRQWLLTPGRSGGPSRPVRRHDACTDTPGSRPECSRCPVVDSPGSA